MRLSRSNIVRQRDQHRVVAGPNDVQPARADRHQVVDLHYRRALTVILYQRALGHIDAQVEPQQRPDFGWCADLHEGGELLERIFLRAEHIHCYCCSNDQDGVERVVGSYLKKKVVRVEVAARDVEEAVAHGRSLWREKWRAVETGRYAAQHVREVGACASPMLQDVAQQTHLERDMGPGDVDCSLED